jgi:DNA-binding response OmpR family regulator
VQQEVKASCLGSKLELCELDIDTITREVTFRGKCVRLGTINFNVLVSLARRAGTVVPRALVLEESGSQGARPVRDGLDVHIGRLCKKFGKDRIWTLKGSGWEFVP